MSDPQAFERFLAALPRAQNESQKREAFIALASRGFGDEELGTHLALGAEHQTRFLKAGAIRRGAIDCFFGNLIIEFERDLPKTRSHAMDQLRAYTAGAWSEDGSPDRSYLAIATDGNHWEIFSPRLDGATISVERVLLDQIQAESFGPGEGQQLYEFLNRLLFRRDLLPPTAANFVSDFGLTSPAFLRTHQVLRHHFSSLTHLPQLKILLDAWSSSLQVCYGSIETDEDLFIRHTYLAILARLLAWASLERRTLKADEIESILNGKYFYGRLIENLVEDDFFKWHLLAEDLSNPWTPLANQLRAYDLGALREDILKPVYEQLVDPITRHELGEYYTPDWLAEKVVDHLLGTYRGENPPTIIDPACGSGTFLRASIARLRTAHPSASLTDILESVQGIDIHPLAVTISRVTYLLAVRDLLQDLREPISIPVYLANSLQLPISERQVSFARQTVRIRVGEQSFELPLDFIEDSTAYDDALSQVLRVAKAFGNEDSKLADLAESLKHRLTTSVLRHDHSGDVVEPLTAIATEIALLIRAGRDSVHGFLLRNYYRPSMLRGQFDFVVGNPPWLTYGQIKTPEYQSLLLELVKATGIASRSTGERSHTEIATLFLSFTAVELLRRSSDGRIALVLPRSIMTAKHHRRLREGSYKPIFNVSEIWDLNGVTPLFNVPALVLIVTIDGPTLTRPGKVVTGKLPAREMHLDAALPHLDFRDTSFRLDYLGKRSTWREADHPSQATPERRNNYYTKEFRQGAVLYPQALLVVQPVGPVGDRFSPVRVNSMAGSRLKKWKTFRVDHIIESGALHLTAAAEHILPFAIDFPLWNVTLPAIEHPGSPGFRSAGPDEIRRQGFIETARWLEWAEKSWAAERKETDTTPLFQRLDHLGHLTAQSTQRRFILLYTSAASRPFAAVLDREGLNQPFVARDRTYWASFDSIEEADFVCAFLNSDFGAAKILDWMNRGLFGPRDINKRILDVAWPRFEPTSSTHLDLCHLSRGIADQATSLHSSLKSRTSGRRRRELRSLLDQADLGRLDALVERISSSVG